jgi:nucleotide-binding universal stress UspA family protein
MSYKTILVHLNESEHAYERIKIAAKLAKRCDAHLLGVAATALPGTYYMPGIFGESGVSLMAYLDLLREQAKNAAAQLEAVAQKTGVASFEERIVEDEAGAGVSLYARHSDLAVVGQTDPDESLPALRRDFPEYVVMNSGCPVLIVPYAGEFDDFGKRVMIAWNASIEASRAVAGAIPLLRQADDVQVVVFDGKTDAYGEKPGADVALFLARHGIKVEVSPQVAGNIDIGSALLSQAADFNADLMVMGCYGHARFREALLGGVTQTILESMTVPTLMCH